jgi:predicted DNA-binding ArsR family transcriptional regulator
MIGGGVGRMRAVKLSVFVLVVLVWGILLAACSKPPEAEKEAAKKAMDAAISAGADKYATVDLEVAKKLWESADSKVKDKKYKEAKEDYIAAKAAFEKAAAAVEAGKKVLADQANAALKELEVAWKRLSATGKKMEKKLKEKKTAWRADAEAIEEGLRKAKETIIVSPDEAKAKLDELKTMIDRWESTFKKMAAAPQKPKATKKKKR